MTVVHEVAFNVPLDLWKSRKNLTEIVFIRQEIWYDYRMLPDLTEAYRDEIQRLDDVSYQTLRRRAHEHDGPSMFEYALRNLTKCDAPGEFTVHKALRIFEALSGDEAPLRDYKLPNINNCDHTLWRRARAARAWIHFHLHFTARRCGTLLEIYSNPYMNNAAYASNFAATHTDFVPRIALRVASWLMTLNTRYLVDVRKAKLFDEFTYLWKAYDDYLAWQGAKERERLEKVAKAPNLYRCAAEGCGVQAVHRSALRKCGGRCPPSRKPHYCSWACQERHWFIHRHFCKYSIVEELIPDDDGDPNWVDEDSYDAEYPYTHLPERRLLGSWPDSEIFVDIPHPSQYWEGHVFRIRTKMFSPDFLRSYRALWQQPDWRRRCLIKAAQVLAPISFL